MSLTVITGWSPTCWATYAHRFYDTFARFWPPSARLVVYGEEKPGFPLPRAEWHNLAEIPGCLEFLERNDNPRARGREPTERWKDRERAAGYSFKWDAMKFSRQGFIPYAALQHCPADTHLLWLDADVVTHRDVNPAVIEQLLNVEKDCLYLGREGKWSEIGFQLYRLRRTHGGPLLPRIVEHLKLFSETYRTDAVFSLEEWHSAHVFDHCRRIVLNGHAQNLTPNGRGHVFKDSVLSAWMRHDKGDRKYRG